MRILSRRGAILEWPSHVKYEGKMALDAIHLLLGLRLTYYEKIGGQL